MEIGRSFNYIFKDEKWASKLLIGAVVSAVPILNFAWTGFGVDIVKNVSKGSDIPLPDWSDFGDKFMKGLFLWLAGIIYSLPMLIVLGITIPLSLIPAWSSNTDVQTTWATVTSGAGIVIACCLSLYILLLSFLLPAVLVHFSRVGTFGSCFQLGEIFRLATRNLGNYLIAWIMTVVFAVVIGLIVGVVGAILVIIPCIGWILGWLIGAFGTVWISTVAAHLFGQVGAEVAM